MTQSYYDTVDINKIISFTHGPKQGCYFGCGAISKFADIVDEFKPSCVGFVCTKSAYLCSGAFPILEKVLSEKKIPFIVYNKIVTNPTTDSIDEATKIFREKYDTNFLVCSIGGGSPGDSGKCVSSLLEHPGYTAAQLYRGEFIPTPKRSKLVMINITSGTGTEVNKVAVGSISNSNPPIKCAIKDPPYYSDYSIDDPALTTSLSEHETRYTSIDVLNHAMETVSTVKTTPLSVSICKEASFLVSKYLPIALKEPGNLRARYWLMYAALSVGIAFDDTELHLTHSMEHILAAYIPTLTHGLGLAVLQPGVLRHTWPASGVVFAYCFSELLPGLTGKPDEAQQAFDLMRAWLASVGCKETMATIGFKKEQVDTLVEVLYITPGGVDMASNCTVPAGKKEMKEIYLSGFYE